MPSSTTNTSQNTIAPATATTRHLNQGRTWPRGSNPRLTVAVAAFVLIVWRYFCELAVLAYQIFNRLGEIRDRLPPPAGRAG